MAQPKNLKNRETLVGVLDLDSPRDHSHQYRVSRTLDTEAVFNLLTALMVLGHLRGKTLYNHPPPERTPEAERWHTITRQLGPLFRLLFASRPALDEDRTAVNRVRKPAYTDLERTLQAVWRPYFQMLRRNMLVLAPHLHKLLRPGFENRGHIEFSMRQGSRYSWLAGGRRALPKEPRTVAFLLNRPDFYKGAALTSCFALDGVTGLIWSELLSTRYSAWLTQPGLRMVELIGTPIPRRMEDLGFTDAWEAVSLFHTEA